MEEILERKVKRAELIEFFGTNRNITRVLNMVVRTQPYNRKSEEEERISDVKDITVGHLYDFFTESTQSCLSWRNIGRQSMSGLDRWARSLGLEETPYFFKHLPIVGENPVPTEMGKLRINTWDGNVVPSVFVAGLGQNNLVYWDADFTPRFDPKPEGDVKIASFDQVLDYRRNQGALAERAIRELTRSKYQ